MRIHLHYPCTNSILGEANDPDHHPLGPLLVNNNEALQVFGHLERDKEKLCKPTISGKWDKGLWADMEDGSRLELWQPNPPPPDPTRHGIALS